MTPSPPSETKEFWLFGYGSLIWKPPPHYDLRLPGSIVGYVRRFWQARSVALVFLTIPVSTKVRFKERGGTHTPFQSEDHRGTPSSPGRVVTLIEQSYYEKVVNLAKPNLRVHGAAYRIPPQHVSEVSAYLDLREINGYSIQYTDFYPSAPIPTTPSASGAERGGAVIRCLVYIGLPTNPQFLGVQRPEDVAEVIWRSRGPSGENAEYLFMLESALEGLGEGGGDEHVSDLARRVRALEAGAAAKGVLGDGAVREAIEDRIGKEAVSAELERVQSGAEGGHSVQEETEKP